MNYERISGDQQTGSRRELGADPYEHVDPFTYRPRMSALDWIKVCGWGRFSDSIAPIASLIVYDPGILGKRYVHLYAVIHNVVGDLQHSMASSSEAISNHHS